MYRNAHINMKVWLSCVPKKIWVWGSGKKTATLLPACHLLFRSLMALWHTILKILQCTSCIFHTLTHFFIIALTTFDYFDEIHTLLTYCGIVFFDNIRQSFEGVLNSCDIRDLFSGRVGQIFDRFHCYLVVWWSQNSTTSGCLICVFLLS